MSLSYHTFSESKIKAAHGRRELIRIPNIADHFHTNEPPDDPDAQLFAKTLSNAIDRESFLQEEIRYLETTLYQRIDELSRVQQIIREYKPVLSSVRRLPRELLMEIFFQVLGSVDPEDVLDFDRGLWPLTHVCRLWRTLILNHTSFWTTVSLPGRTHYPPYSIHILSLFLDRSGSQPIFVDFTCRDVAKLPETLFSVLFAQSYRWETCKLRIPVFLTDRLSPGAIERTQLLRHLDLNLDLAYSSPLVSSCKNLFAGAPALRSVKLTGVPLALDTLGLRWSYLTHYDVTQDFPDKHLAILRLATGLVECTIDCSQPWRQQLPGAAAIVTLRKLRILKLKGTASILLEYLVAPGLHSLSVLLPETGDSLKIFLNRSVSRLHELEIEATPMGNNILDALQYVSCLSKLALNVSISPGSRRKIVFKDFLVALRYVSSGNNTTSITGCKLPRLEELFLSVYTSSSEHLYANELADMVVSRWKLPGKIREQELTQLKRFTLETNRDWLPAFDTFKELMQEGLQAFINLH
ncbi:hypothetical protein J3R30DRAFT_2705685 [Lentinula aciculospora]|uniref:F-box domain-containing protein n=1 Tax=Lentinula aciculospora TaxID=153920 RepID=A0A9W9DP91_9AGAR|nr:hypothetical protein J3R30DRAFT_2705685 [Lentinula aciculospora]